MFGQGGAPGGGMIDPRMAQMLMQGGVGGPGGMQGPQVPVQMVPQQAPPPPPQSGAGAAGMAGGMGGAMQDPRLQAYLRAIMGGGAPGGMGR